MKDIQQIENILANLESLLLSSSQIRWANALENIRNMVTTDTDNAVSHILRLYGGMGSFNDLILYKNGQLLVEENTKFDDLRRQLYELVR